MSLLEQQPELLVVCEVSDGLAAVQKAEEMQPDLILLDIGLPKLNGIEVARQVRKLSIGSKILFLSQESSADMVQAALSHRSKRLRRQDGCGTRPAEGRKCSSSG